MHEARKGKGIDRHLFGLWCVAYENKLPIPSFYEDPLYAKSGGAGNFVLSTSTLGYSVCNSGVAPMTKDGYGCFYTMLNESIWIVITEYTESDESSSSKLYESFERALNEIRELLEKSEAESKL